MAQRTEVPGVATGLAWTAAGGDILFIEATKMGGKNGLTLTGQLGNVMKESAQAAQSYLRARSPEFGVPENFWEKQDVHIHVPAGGIPKDGPSAGVTMMVALTSLVTGIKVRAEVAMTGEITLRGNVLPVGGIKEKVLAALRAGVKEVILPERNEKDLFEVPKEVQDRLKFHFVKRVDEVLDIALGPPERFPPKLAPPTGPERSTSLLTPRPRRAPRFHVIRRRRARDERMGRIIFEIRRSESSTRRGTCRRRSVAARSSRRHTSLRRLSTSKRSRITRRRCRMLPTPAAFAGGRRLGIANEHCRRLRWRVS